jgi:putative transposase
MPLGLAILVLPSGHRRRLRCSRTPERQNDEIKRRTRLAGLFRNESSAIRLVSALLIEISKEWKPNRKYLTMGPASPAHLQPKGQGETLVNRVGLL